MTLLKSDEDRATLIEPYRSGAEILAQGRLEGASGHIVQGSVSLQKLNGRVAIVFNDAFFFDGAPSTHVALGANGFRNDAIVAPLERNDGSQVYVTPEGLNTAAFNEVWLWSVEFSVPLARAALSPPETEASG